MPPAAAKLKVSRSIRGKRSPQKGGQSLSATEAECLQHCGDYEGGGGAEAVRSRVLRGGAPLIPFDQRFNADFQLVTLRLLVAALHGAITASRRHVGDSASASSLAPPKTAAISAKDLTIPSHPMRTLIFREHVRLLICSSNTGV